MIKPNRKLAVRTAYKSMAKKNSVVQIYHFFDLFGVVCSGNFQEIRVFILL